MKNFFIILACVFMMGCRHSGFDRLLGLNNTDSNSEAIQANASPDSVPFESLLIYDFNQNELASLQAIKINTQKDLEKIWEDTHAQISIPFIDFNKDMCILLQDQNQNSGGHAIRVTQIHVKNGKMFIQAVRLLPAPGQITAAVITQPGQVVKTFKNSLPIEISVIQQ